MDVGFVLSIFACYNFNRILILMKAIDYHNSLVSNCIKEKKKIMMNNNVFSF